MFLGFLVLVTVLSDTSVKYLSRDISPKKPNLLFPKLWCLPCAFLWSGGPVSRHVTFNAFFVAQETRVRRGLQHPKFRVCLSHLKAEALHMLNFVQISVMSCKTVEIHGPQVHRAVYCEECVVSRASSTGWQSGTLENSQCGHRERTMRREADWDGFSCIREDLLSVLLKFMWSCFVCTYFSFLTPRPCVSISN